MKPLLLAVPFVFLAHTALAGTLRCSFTEPFFSIEFDSATGLVTLTSPEDTNAETGEIEPQVIAREARLVSDKAGEELAALHIEADGARILELRVSGRGSDGMSDYVFPWDGKYGVNVGGCETDVARGYDLYDAYRDLGLEQ